MEVLQSFVSTTSCLASTSRRAVHQLQAAGIARFSGINFSHQQSLVQSPYCLGQAQQLKLFSGEREVFGGSRTLGGVAFPRLCAFGPGLGRRGRSVFYEDADMYVFLEPGKDELFLTTEELQATLKKLLESWAKEEWPADLATFTDADTAVNYLISSACELDLRTGQGSLQWFEVRLEPDASIEEK